MPSGGPAYPLAAPGIRLRVLPTDSLTLLAGVFNGDPAGGPAADPQRRDANGAMFSLHNGVLAIAEVQYAINQPALGDMVGATPQLTGLPGTYKLGTWYDSENFADQQLDSTGLSLANPASNGMPLRHRGDVSVYAVADQMVWRPDPQSTKSVNVFLRVMGAPDDRNLVSFSANGGVTLKAPFEGRDSDSAGIGVGHVRVSSRAAALDRDTAAFTGAYVPARTGETFVELTYQYQVNPWWQLQPDLQYTINPGGGLADPNDPGKRIGNEVVAGVRTVITF
jgi:porin